MYGDEVGTGWCDVDVDGVAAVVVLVCLIYAIGLSSTCSHIIKYNRIENCTLGANSKCMKLSFKRAIVLSRL